MEQAESRGYDPITQRIIKRRYVSSFTTRYGSDPMSKIWEDTNRQTLARKLWIAVAETQARVGLATEEEVDDLKAHAEVRNVDEIDSREMDEDNPRYTGHDILAAISVFADEAPKGGRVLHQGMTSDDVWSNVEIMQIIESSALVDARLATTLSQFGSQIDRYKDLVCMGFTHGQAGEPTTVGYRLARYAQDLLLARQLNGSTLSHMRGKGIKGAVGTSASFEHLLEGTGMTAMEHEADVMAKLDLAPVLISGQTYPRILTHMALSGLSTVALACHQFASDVKTLQSSPYDEWAEPRSPRDRSSSAMLHKRNPRHSENIKSLARGIPTKVMESWITGAEVTLERGIEDSAGKRSYLPEAYLAVDEMLRRTERIIKGLQVNEVSIARNMRTFGPFAALEIVLAELGKRGAHRQEMDAVLRGLVTKAIDEVREGQPNPLIALVSGNKDITAYIPQPEVVGLFDKISNHVGDASARCELFLSSELYPNLKGK